MEGLSISTSSEPITPQRALERLFTEPELQLDAWFACTSIDFMILKEQDLDELPLLLDCLTCHFGAYLHVEQAADEEADEENQDKEEGQDKEVDQEDDENDQILLVHFEQGVIPTSICVDPNTGRIVELCFGPPGEEFFPIEPKDAVAKLQNWPGEHSLLVLENGAVMAALNAEQPLAVGSAFKLAVLCALKRQIDAGERSWSDVAELRKEWKSLPSGILQDWPDGSPVTLNTLATLMISISDNTAADSLIHLLGKEAVELQLSSAGRRINRPFLTTREFFLLKHPESESLLALYRKLGAAGGTDDEIIQRRRTFLEDVVGRSPLPDEFPNWVSPTALDVEFFFSARELCGLIDQVCDLGLMGVNTGGIMDRSEWAHIAFKGGSEPGVLNLTIWLEAHNGKRFHLVLTANDPDAPLNETKLILLLLRLLETLKARG